MKNMTQKIQVLLILSIMATTLTFAQQPTNGMVMDRVVARVGDMMIMESDLMGKMMVMKQNDPSVNEKDPEFRKKMLDELIDNKLIIAKANEDSLIVTESQVNQSWSMWLDGVISRYGSEKRIEQMYRMPLSEIQNKMKQEIRYDQLQRMAINAKFGDMKVVRNEVEDFYKRNKDSLPEIPKSIEVFHLVRNVKVKESLKEDIEALALRVRDSILSGGDFAAFAKVYSEDVYSKNDGGNLGWFEKTKLFPEFVKAAAKLQQGEVSMPIETPLGMHLIQTLEKDDSKLNTRHILFKIGKTEKDQEEAMDFLKMLKDSIEKSSADFELLAKRHSEDIETRGFGGSLGLLPIAEFPANLQLILRDMPDGAVSDPLIYQKDSYHIIYKKRTVDAHKANLDDDYRILENMALMEKKSKSITAWLKQLRADLYWEYVENK